MVTQPEARAGTVRSFGTPTAPSFPRAPHFFSNPTSLLPGPAPCGFGGWFEPYPGVPRAYFRICFQTVLAGLRGPYPIPRITQGLAACQAPQPLCPPEAHSAMWPSLCFCARGTCCPRRTRCSTCPPMKAAPYPHSSSRQARLLPARLLPSHPRFWCHQHPPPAVPPISSSQMWAAEPLTHGRLWVTPRVPTCLWLVGSQRTTGRGPLIARPFLCPSIVQAFRSRPFKLVSFLLLKLPLGL